MKWCLHKGTAWCEWCEVFHCDPWVEITAFGSPHREYFCQLCNGMKTEPHDLDEIEWGPRY